MTVKYCFIKQLFSHLLSYDTFLVYLHSYIKKERLWI